MSELEYIHCRCAPPVSLHPRDLSAACAQFTFSFSLFSFVHEKSTSVFTQNWEAVVNVVVESNINYTV